MIPDDLPWSLYRTATRKIIIIIEMMFDETRIRNNGVAVDSLSARKHVLSVLPDVFILNIKICFKILLDVIFDNLKTSTFFN